jgi:hypothetical protein
MRTDTIVVMSKVSVKVSVTQNGHRNGVHFCSEISAPQVLEFQLANPLFKAGSLLS